MEDEINLTECFIILKKRLIWIVAFVLICLVGTFAYSKNSTKIYQSDSFILLIGGDQAASSILSKVALLTGNSGLGSSGRSSLTTNLSVILTSRTLAENVVNRLDLSKYYYKDSWDVERGQWKAGLKKIPSVHDVAKILLGNVKVKKDSTNPSVFNFTVNDKDPSISLAINKAYLVELQNYLNDNTLTDAKRQKLFIESQLFNYRKEMLEVGKELGRYYTENRNSTSTSSLVDVYIAMPDISYVAEKISSKEIAAADTSILQQQKSDLDEKIKSAYITNVPLQVYYEYLVQKRLVLMALSSSLSDQYEIAKINAAKEDISFLVIDEAILPQFSIWPNTKKNLLFAFCLSLFVSCFAVFLVEYLQNAKSKVK